ncbi:MAG: 30S ribosome-binding factor RbfA [Candidatus Polarisedimenticolaceae bacterium]|nr:30S ribosome-binding factor RbfA [Candidatus Polarisedimenticolaceae bacterium]
MHQDFSRTDRIGQQIQRELAALVRDELKDPRLGMVTIQAVKVVRDLSHAKVYFTILNQEGDRAESTKLLKVASGFLRKMLGQRMKLRTVPQLNFVYDDSIEYGAHLSSLIEKAVSSDANAKDEDEQ